MPRKATAATGHASFGDNAVRPFYQRDKDRRTTEFCSATVQVCFRDPTGPGTSPSRKNRNALGDDLFERFLQRGPPPRVDGIRRLLSHQIGCLGDEEDLHFVAGL